MTVVVDVLAYVVLLLMLFLFLLLFLVVGTGFFVTVCSIFIVVGRVFI